MCNELSQKFLLPRWMLYYVFGLYRLWTLILSSWNNGILTIIRIQSRLPKQNTEIYKYESLVAKINMHFHSQILCFYDAWHEYFVIPVKTISGGRGNLFIPVFGVILQKAEMECEVDWNNS
jgi:hypothetical protein